jgi:hypothetical protein
LTKFPGAAIVPAMMPHTVAKVDDRIMVADKEYMIGSGFSELVI